MGIVAGSGSRRNIWLSNASAREETTGVWIVTSITGALMGLCALGLAYTAPAHTHVVVRARMCCSWCSSCMPTLSWMDRRIASAWPAVPWLSWRYFSLCMESCCLASSSASWLSQTSCGFCELPMNLSLWLYVHVFARHRGHRTHYTLVLWACRCFFK